MNICIYGASSDEIDEIYFSEVEKLARALGKEKHTLVFGGGTHGMMGAAARGFYEEGGKVIGVAPSFFHQPGVLFEHCEELIATETMRERKQIMEERSDAFIAVPGGIGTLDELFEIMTLRQLSRHKKPVIIYNINGFYDTLLAFLKELEDGKFMRSESDKYTYSVCSTANEVIQILKSNN